MPSPCAGRTAATTPRSSGPLRAVARARKTAVALLATLVFALAPGVPGARAAEPLRLASLEWEPYIGSRLPEQGFAAALVRAAFADQGMTVEIEFHSWERALELARSGAVDGLLPEYYNGQRESEFAYSAPLFSGPLVFYRRREADIRYRSDPAGPLDAGLRALAAYRFGVVRGYLNTPAFDAADYLTKLEADDDADNLRRLAEGRIDLAVIDRRVAEHLIGTQLPEYADALVPVSPKLGELSLYIAFSRKSPRMAKARAAFDRGLETLGADGRLNALRRRLLDGGPR